MAMRACSGPAQGQARKESQQGSESGQEIPPLAVNYIETLTTMDDNWRESQLSSGMWPLRSYPDSKTWPHSQVDTGSAKRTLWVLKKIKKTQNWKKKDERNFKGGNGVDLAKTHLQMKFSIYKEASRMVIERCTNLWLKIRTKGKFITI